jgi:3-dehydroquinate dehydratase
MKRPTKQKVNNGPATPRNRAEKKKKAQEFITECEKSLIRLIEQKSREKGCKWTDLELELRHRFTLLKKSYPNHKGKVAIAVHNVEEALKVVRWKRL